MKCLECGFDLKSESNSSDTITEIVIRCPNCGWTAVTTTMFDIVDDLTKYTIVIDSGNDAEKETMKKISKLSGHNILESKKILTDGGVMLSDYAIDIVDIIPQLDLMGIKYHIDPKFPY